MGDFVVGCKVRVGLNDGGGLSGDDATTGGGVVVPLSSTDDGSSEDAVDLSSPLEAATETATIITPATIIKKTATRTN